jgi:hypothetical protein
MDATSMRAIRIPILIVLFGVSGLMAVPAVGLAAESATASVVVTAQFGSRTSLKVSSELLQFDVVTADQSALATVEFSAAARTRHGGEVVLTIERVGAVSGPGGAADIETSLTVSVSGSGGATGELDPSAQIVAGRWVGSGRRTGQLSFSLRSAVPGAYSVPVRFVLSAP